MTAILPDTRIEVAKENATVINGKPVLKTTWRFRQFSSICGATCEGDVSEMYSVSDAAAECQRWLDRGVPVYPRGSAA